jgi:hypothetical protein
VAYINKYSIISSYPIITGLGVWYSEFVNFASLSALALNLFLEKSSLPKKAFYLVISLSQKKAMG